MNNIAKYQLEIVLSDILSNYGFLDRLTVIEFFLDKISNTITGVFCHNQNEIYGYCITLDSKNNVESIKWSKNG